MSDGTVVSNRWPAIPVIPAIHGRAKRNEVWT